MLLAGSVRAQSTYTWQPTASANWNVAANWLDQTNAPTVPVSGTATTLNFGGTTAYTATNDIGAFTLNVLNFSGNGAKTLAGSALMFDGTNAAVNLAAGTGAVAIGNNVTFNASTAVTNNSSNALGLNGLLTFKAGTTTTFSGSGNMNLNAAAAQVNGLSFENGSSIIYTGSGTLAVGPQGVNGTLNNIVFANNGTYNFTNGVQGGSSTGNLSMGDNASGAANTTLLYGPATGVTLNFANYSSGTLGVGNMAQLSGTVNILAGTVKFGITTGAINTGGDLFGNNMVLNVAAGATFDFNGNGETMGAISGTGTITGANMTMQITGNRTWGGTIAGTAGFSTGVAGANYTFTGTNTSSGTTTIAAGSSLTLGNGGTTGSVAGTIANSGTLTFNRSDGFSVPNIISGTGTVVQGGTGTVTLAGVNTYSGNTVVNSGTLAVGATGILPATSLQVTVASGAVLDLTAVAGGYTVGSGRTLIVGRTGSPSSDVLGSITVGGTLDVGGVNAARTATFANALTLNGASVRFDLSNTTGSNNDVVSVGGNLTLTGTNAIAINLTAGSLATGSYTLFNYTGTLTGTAANLSLAGLSAGTTRQTITPNLGTGTNSAVTLTVAGASANLTWVGNAGNNVWDLVTTANFTGAPGATPDNRFYNLDAVTFDASGVGGATAVTLTGTLNPSSVTVTGTQNYTIGGTGAIGGTGFLTKNGSGTLTVGTANTYAGVTTINAGMFTVGTGGSIAGPVTVNGGTVTASVANAYAGNFTINGGSVVGFAGAYLGNFTVNGGSLSISSDTNLAAAATVTLNGGTLQVTGAYSSTGSTQTFVVGPNGGTIDVAAGIVCSKLGDQVVGPGNTLTKIGLGTLTIG
jgi:autotransporter-associated beta strand protein